MATIFDDAGMDELARSPEIAAVVMKVTEHVADTARSTAPVNSGDDPKALVIEATTGNLARAAKMAGRKR